MYNTLRGESFKAVLPRIIVLVLIAVILLGLSGGGIIRLIAGPKPLSNLNPDQLEGKYISFDASEIIVAFASLSQNGDSGSKTLETYYLLPSGDGRYLAVMDRKERHADVIEKAMEQSHEYYMGDLITLRTLGDVAGTAKSLDPDMPAYMADCIDNYELPGYQEGLDSQSLLIPVQIELDNLGFFEKPLTLVLGGLGLLLLLLALAQSIVVLAGIYQKNVRMLMGNAPDEEDFTSAQQFERIRVGDYIWFSKGPVSRCVKTGDLIWGYALPEPLVVSKYRWPVALYNMEQTLTRIDFMDQRNCQLFLKAVSARNNHFRVGYTSEAAEQFQNDLEGFLRDTEIINHSREEVQS